VVIDAGGVVLHVEPFSMAAQAQLQAGDILLSINGLTLNDDRQKVKAAIGQASPTSPLMVRISRSGNILELSAVPASPSTAPVPAQPISTATPVFPPEDYL
jgi:S1-C subfamily serine protease